MSTQQIVNWRCLDMEFDKVPKLQTSKAGSRDTPPPKKNNSLKIYFYRLQHSCGKVIFSQASVILSTGGWGVWQTPLLGRHPPQTPPEQTPPRANTPWEGPPRADTPLGRHSGADTPPGRHPPAQYMLGYTHTPCPVHAGIHTPPAHCMLGYMPSPRGHCSGRYASY